MLGRAVGGRGLRGGRGCSGIVLCPGACWERVLRQMGRGVSGRGLRGGVSASGRGLLERCRALAGNRDAHLGVLSETWERLAIREVSFQLFPEPLHSERKVHSRDGM